MFRVTTYDLNDEIEMIGLYQDVVDRIQERKKIISKKPRLKYKLTDEQRKARSQQASISRTRSKVRRLAQKYNLRYMWTLTFAEKYVKNYNSKKTYDAGNYEDAWHLWKNFLKRCKRAGLEFNYIATMELSEKRLEKYNEKVYHFHFITNKKIPVNKKRQLIEKAKYNLEDLWSHGYVFVNGSDKKKKNRAYQYIVKYIAKTFDDISDNRNRYRTSEKMFIEKDVIFLTDHIEFLQIADRKDVKVSNYNVLGKELEIFWMIVKKEKG